MLIAKLKEPVEKIYQGPDLTTITVSCQYMSVAVENYEMNQPKTNFYYKIGNVEFTEEGTVEKFKPVIRGYTVLTSEELSDWGTDDFNAIKAVALKLGIELDEEVRLNAQKIRFQS
jgi:hypothetical protein